MHELSIALSLIELASEHARRAGAGRITRLNCRVGALLQIEDDLLRDAFEAARPGTPCEAAELSIEKAPLRAQCPRCRRSFVVKDWDWNCPICRAEGEPLDGGDELELVSIEAPAPCEDIPC
jgi:hydrogenase nickel incorporation protein HypA/HybF